MSDRRREQAFAELVDVVKSVTHKTETRGGGSLQRLVELSRWRGRLAPVRWPPFDFATLGRAPIFVFLPGSRPHSRAYVQPVGSGEPALKYLAAYVYRTAFSAERILADDGRHITFAYRDNQGRRQIRRLPAEKFLHLYLQHVLPRGFQRVRYYGWLSPAAKTRFERIAALLDWKVPAPVPVSTVVPPECPDCRKPMFLVGRLPRPPP